VSEFMNAGFDTDSPGMDSLENDGATLVMRVME
jgi:hypothetical protein